MCMDVCFLIFSAPPEAATYLACRSLPLGSCARTGVAKNAAASATRAVRLICATFIASSPGWMRPSWAGFNARWLCCNPAQRSLEDRVSAGEQIGAFDRHLLIGNDAAAL